MFRVNQKVVCVDASAGRSSGLPSPLRLNAIYTIKEIGTLPDLSGDVGVRLYEVDPPTDARPLFGFRLSRFRPLVERKTDISVFTAMLNPSPVTVDAMKIADVAREIAE